MSEPPSLDIVVLKTPPGTGPPGGPPNNQPHDAPMDDAMQEVALHEPPQIMNVPNPTPHTSITNQTPNSPNPIPKASLSFRDIVSGDHH